MKEFDNRFNTALNELYGRSYFEEVLYTDGELAKEQYDIALKKLEVLGHGEMDFLSRNLMASLI